MTANTELAPPRKIDQPGINRPSGKPSKNQIMEMEPMHPIIDAGNARLLDDWQSASQASGTTDAPKRRRTPDPNTANRSRPARSTTSTESREKHANWTDSRANCQLA